jgi:hypothetical protein
MPVRHGWNTTCAPQLSLWLAWTKDNTEDHETEWDTQKAIWFCVNCGIDLEKVRAGRLPS